MRERLQKIMAACGVASRRACEEMIAAGRVTVNGAVVRELGTKADLDADAIAVDGKRIERAEKLVYFLLNKPKGYVTTASDPEGRPTVMDLMRDCAAFQTPTGPRSSGQAVLPTSAEPRSSRQSALPTLAERHSSTQARVYPVGRLDYASEGLLLMTNDGALAKMLTKASSHVPKTYLVKVSGRPTDEKIERLRRGITIETDDGRRVRTSPARIRLMKESGQRPVTASRPAARGEEEKSASTQRPQRAEHRGHKALTRTDPRAAWRASSERTNPWYEVTLIEGRNRQIRRMFEKIGHHVEKIRRVQLGPLTLDVEVGKFRQLKANEIEDLKRAAGDKRNR